MSGPLWRSGSPENRGLCHADSCEKGLRGQKRCEALWRMSKTHYTLKTDALTSLLPSVLFRFLWMFSKDLMSCFPPVSVRPFCAFISTISYLKSASHYHVTVRFPADTHHLSESAFLCQTSCCPFLFSAGWQISCQSLFRRCGCSKFTFKCIAPKLVPRVAV